MSDWHLCDEIDMRHTIKCGFETISNNLHSIINVANVDVGISWQGHMKSADPRVVMVPAMTVTPITVAA